MIVKALHKQLKEKSVKTRQCCFNMLTELVNVLPGALTSHIPVLVPGMHTHTHTHRHTHSFSRSVRLFDSNRQVKPGRRTKVSTLTEDKLRFSVLCQF